MCGLVGLMKNNMFISHYQKFRDLMVVAQLRGDDGSGIISVPKATLGEDVKHVNIKRSTWSSGHLVTLTDFDDVTKGDRSALLGHARQPTKGASTIENVHPHREGHISLMHNGTMSHVGGQAVPNGKSDSKMIAKYLSEHTPQEFVQNSFGAYCLTWIDLDKQTINFLRNSERTLYFAEEKFSNYEHSSTETLFWASEMSMLIFVLSRYAGYTKDRMRYYPLPANEHWEFPLNVSATISEPKITKCENVYSNVGKYSGIEYAYGWEGWEEELEKDPTPPFEHRAGPSTNANLPVVRKDATTSSAPFSYIPPEHRQNSTTAVRSISTLIADSRRIALNNASNNDQRVINLQNKKEVRSQ